MQKLFPRIATPYVLDEWYPWNDVGLLFPCAYDNTGNYNGNNSKKFASITGKNNILTVLFAIL